MASLYQESNGIWIIQLNDGNRPKIRLGKLSKRQAQATLIKVEDLVSATSMGHSPNDETSRWVISLDDKLRNRLAKLGLTNARQYTKLKSFIEAYIQSRQVDVKPNTIEIYQHVLRNLLAYFGPNRTLQSITVGDADDFMRYLIGQGLAENTVKRRCGLAKQFMEEAIKWELISRNPFTMKVTVRGNPKRQSFISREDALRVINACPDSQWRLIFALSRFAGLRCPSEHIMLRWADVNWKKGWFLVYSPKTEHHHGKESRRVPIFPDLAPHLREAFELAEPNEEFIITRYRSPNVNLRTQLHNIIKNAGLKPWPKSFHNLRSSCQTELSQQHPGYLVCAWIGNSEDVAKEHYLQIMDEDFTKAAQWNQAVQNPVQQGTIKDCKPLQVVQSLKNKLGDCSNLQKYANDRNHTSSYQAGLEGLEPSTF